MEELFRFSVVRPASNAVANVIDLITSPLVQNRGNVIAQPQQTFVQKLQEVAKKENWTGIESEAWVFLQDPNRITAIKNIFDSDIYRRLKDFANQLRAVKSENLSREFWPGEAKYATVPAWTIETEEIAKAYLTSANLQDRSVLPFGNYKLSDLNTSLLSDLFLALMIVRSEGPVKMHEEIKNRDLWGWSEFITSRPSLTEIADVLRAVNLLVTYPDNVKTPEEVTKALEATVLLPPSIFSRFAKPIHGVGFRDLHIVKQHIRKYEAAEIARIENILAGESRSHIQKHTLSKEETTTVETESSKETDNELTTTDHVSIKNETSNQVKEDTKVDAGVHAKYSAPSFNLNADLTVSYNKSTENSRKFSSEIAKDITQKAVSKVTQRIKQTQTTKITEIFEETESQSFDNKNNPNVCGVYQWVQKTYLAQVFNFGRHMLFDIMVPEPAASLIDMAQLSLARQEVPVQPDPLGTFHMDHGMKILDSPLKVNQLSLVTAGEYISKFQVTGVEPYPADRLSFSKPIMIEFKDDTIKQASDTITLKDGYKAATASISAAWRCNDVSSDHNEQYAYVDVAIGQMAPIRLAWDRKTNGLNATATANFGVNSEQNSISFSLLTFNVNALSLNIEIYCIPSDETYDKWRLSTYEKIVAAWQKLQDDYESKVDQLKYQNFTIGPFGNGDELTNRHVEQTELKRSAIAILSNSNNTVSGNNTPVAKTAGQNPDLSEPVLAMAQAHGAWVRWFEQAFEWENIAYVFYPYYWARRNTWIDRLNIKNDDALFLKFLQAGYARVVVPVRIGFERGVLFYLQTGRPWLGGDMPTIGDATQNPLYLDIAEEIKAQTGAPGDEVPVGEPWEYVLPTTFIKLQKDDTLPEWHRLKPGPAPSISDAPVSDWSWGVGKP